MKGEKIDDIIEQLDAIIQWAQGESSRLGYFAALYRKVTLEVKRGIAEGYFQDGHRMECFDVTFARFYLEAFGRRRSNRETTRSWRLAFEAAKDWWPIVLQHLLLGMNAHINLDLGIAAARTCPGKKIFNLKNDFIKINQILASLVDEVQQKLSRVWPLLDIIDRKGGRADEKLANFSMEKAREKAWSVALKLAPMDRSEQKLQIDRIDREVALLGRIIRYPGPVASTANKIIRLGERGTIPEIIEILK